MAEKKPTYCGPIGRKGVIYKGILFVSPWSWTAAEIKKKVKQYPFIKKWFSDTET